MRLLMLIPHGDASGPMRRIADLLVDGLRGNGCDVSTAAWGGRAAGDSVADRTSERIRDLLRIRRVVASADVDAVVVQTSHEWLPLLRELVLVAILRRRARKIVLQFHGGHSGWLVGRGHGLFKRATALLLRLTDGVLVLSTPQQRHLQAFFPDGRFHVIANPFESSEVAPRPSPNGRAHAPVLLYAGRLLVQKGIFDLIDAVALVGAGGEWRLVVAGDGPEEANAARYAAERGVSERVTFTGRLPRERLFDLYRDADVFVLPARPPEGFPTVISEAMSAGLPIVTSRVGGIPEHLGDGVNALFVPPREPVALAQAIERMLVDKGLRDRMSIANREKVNDFAPNRVAQEYVRALADIVSG